MSSHLLALETSGPRCGVALLHHDGRQARVISRHHDGVSEHSARLLPLVDEVLAEAEVSRAQLDGIAFGQGPGAFTGLRVACGVAQGMGFALDLPLVPVLTPASMEQQLAAATPQWRLVVQDARMSEAYVTVIHRTAEQVQLSTGPLLLPLAALPEWHQQWSAAAGRQAAATEPDQAEAASAVASWLWLSDLAPEEVDAVVAQLATNGLEISIHPSPVRPTAAAVAEVAWAHWQAGVRVAPEDASPIYVRNKVAFTTAERASGEGGNPRAGMPGVS